MFQLFQRPTCPLLRDSSVATYHWVINIFKIIPYVKYRDLLKIIDAEIEEAPMTFEK